MEGANGRKRARKMPSRFEESSVTMLAKPTTEMAKKSIQSKLNFKRRYKYIKMTYYFN